MLTKFIKADLRNYLFILVGVSFSPVCLAGFATYAKDWPNDPEIVNEKIQDVAAPTFLKSTSDAGVCVEDTYGAQNMVPEVGRLYLKVGLNYMDSEVRNLRNTSTGVFANSTLTKKSSKVSYYTWEIAAGTKWNVFRVELDYIYTKEILYNVTPVVQGRTETIQSTVNNTALMLNFMYDWNAFTYFRPYAGVLWGFAWNRTRTALVGGAVGDNASQNSNFFSPLAWGLCVGGRMPFYERWHAYVQYKYTEQGWAKWKSRTETFRMRGTYYLQGFSLGVQYTF